MPTKHAFSITVSRFSLVFKLLVYLLIIALLISALSIALLSTTLKDIWNQVSELDLIDSGKNLLLSGLNGSDLDSQSALYNDFIGRMESFKDICAENIVNINWSIVLVFIMFFLFIFFFTVSNYTVTSIVKSFMNSNTEYGFTAVFVSTIGISFRYSLLLIAIIIPFYLIGFGVALSLGILLAKVSPLIGFALAYTVILLTFSVKRGLLFSWVPSMVNDNKGVIAGLRDSFKVRKRATIDAIGAYFVYFLVVSITSVVAALFSFGVGGIMVIAFGIVYAQVLDLVSYFNEKGYKFYSDERNVIDPSNKYRTVTDKE